MPANQAESLKKDDKMKKIRILHVIFEAEINPWEVAAFRGAIIKQVGRENILFHNHIDDTKYRYGYPLIQYKTNGHNPMIVCIEDGVDEIHRFFEHTNWRLRINKREIETGIKRLNMNAFTMQVWDKHFDYNLHNWLALNSENFQRYEKLAGSDEQHRFLEQILKANIISFAKGIDWTIDKQFNVTISKIRNQKFISFKRRKLLAFHLSFSTDVFLPPFIGLGKGVSRGFGVLRNNSRE